MRVGEPRTIGLFQLLQDDEQVVPAGHLAPEGNVL
jgi:hypothetical protein